MANAGWPRSSDEWPLPTVRFEVKWADQVMHFQEVAGLDAEAQAIEYRHGDSAHFSAIKMPGAKTFGDITMKKGVFKSDNRSWEWFDTARMNTIKRMTVTISLLDEAGAPTMVWTLANAWPRKVSGVDRNATGDEVAVETLVLAHEGLTVG